MLLVIIQLVEKKHKLYSDTVAKMYYTICVACSSQLFDAIPLAVTSWGSVKNLVKPGMIQIITRRMKWMKARNSFFFAFLSVHFPQELHTFFIYRKTGKVGE